MFVRDFPLLFVGLDEHTSIAHEMRITLGEDELNGVRKVERDETKHPLLLVWDPHILNWPKITTNLKSKNLNILAQPKQKTTNQSWSRERKCT